MKKIKKIGWGRDNHSQALFFPFKKQDLQHNYQYICTLFLYILEFRSGETHSYVRSGRTTSLNRDVYIVKFTYNLSITGGIQDSKPNHS